MVGGKGGGWSSNFCSLPHANSYQKPIDSLCWSLLYWFQIRLFITCGKSFSYLLQVYMKFIVIKVSDNMFFAFTRCKFFHSSLSSFSVVMLSFFFFGCRWSFSLSHSFRYTSSFIFPNFSTTFIWACPKRKSMLTHRMWTMVTQKICETRPDSSSGL